MVMRSNNCACTMTRLESEVNCMHNAGPLKLKIEQSNGVHASENEIVHSVIEDFSFLFF